MRKSLISLTLCFIVAMPAFATYYVVMKDGTKYLAKAKPNVVNGKALIQLESGSTITVDPTSIDVAASEEATKYGGGKVLAVDTQHNNDKTASEQGSLGSTIKLRKLAAQQAAAAAANDTTGSKPPIPGAASLGNEVMDKFARAYENIGIYEQKVTSPNAHTVHVELTADSEEKVFNAISATAFLLTRNAAVPGVQIDQVELFMKTTTGGSAGRFQMTRDDATAIDGKTITREDYFVRKVLY